MNMSHFVAFVFVLTLLGSARGAQAMDYICPAANTINCVPVQKTIDAWKDNGGMRTGNAFAPNNICANLIDIPNGMKRLVCCYTLCGVFVQDIQATQCTKTGESKFSCK